MKFLILLLLQWQPHSLAAIYGSDQRREISQLSPAWQEAASAIALALPTHFLVQNHEDQIFHSEWEERNYGEALQLCPNERFIEQTSYGHCTAFLIHPKVLLTAAHCFLPKGKVENTPHPYCDNFSFWFDYNNKSPKPYGTMIDPQKVVHCQKVIYAEINESIHGKDDPIDFALLELSEPIHTIEPLQIDSDDLPARTLVSTIGHPHGLPAKFSGFSPLLAENNGLNTLAVNLDTLGGNSGGPVFNKKQEVVGVLTDGHQFDTYTTKEGCDRINQCDLRGKNCKRNSKLPTSNLFQKMKVIQPHLEKYLEQNQNDLLSKLIPQEEIQSSPQSLTF